VAEPFEIVAHDGARRPRLADAVAEALVHHHRHRHAPVFEALAQLIGIGDGDAPVVLAVLDQGGRLRLPDVAHGRGEAVDLRVVHWIVAEIVEREGSDVGVVVVGRPVGDAGAHRDGGETVRGRSEERRDVAALAPAHAAHPPGIHPPLRHQVIHARKHVPGVAHPQVAHVECAEALAVAGAAAVVHLQDQRAARRPDVRRVVAGVGQEEHRPVDAGGPAMDDAEEGVSFGRVEVGRLDEHALDGLAVPAGPGDKLAGAQDEAGRLGVEVGEAARRERLRRGHENFRERVGGAGEERHGPAVLRQTDGAGQEAVGL